jgi:quercetin dioxygenase-like cupin family protein
MKTLCGLLLAWLVPVSAFAADPSAGITRKVVEQRPLDNGKVLELILVEFPPGAQAPPHVHPAAGLNYILSGQVDSQYEGEPVRRYRAGDTYQDPPERKHLLFRNASASEPLRFLIATELEPDQVFSRPLP